MNIKIILTIFLSLSLQAFAEPAAVQNADADLANKATELTVETGKARIYFITGKDTSGIVTDKPPFKSSSDLLVNDTVIGSINRENLLVADLKPGMYEFYWQPTDTIKSNSKIVPQKMKLNIESGQILVLQGDYHDGMSKTKKIGSLFFGALGALAMGLSSTPTSSLVVASEEDIKNKTLVTPTNCNPSICGN